MKNNILKKFNEKFGYENDVRVFFSPGRVNLIGEHTDYNGGHVFPCALSFGTYGAISQRNDKIVRMYSENFEDKGIISFEIDNLKNEEEHDWANYPKGVIDVLRKHGYDVNQGFDMLVYGNIPNGAGLSSSASLELLMAVMMNDIHQFNIDRVELVKYCQEAENNFIGVNCGIMDQFSIGMGQDSSAILLDCNTLDYKYSTVDLKDEVIVIANTNKRRGLADSKYNERRSECEEALKELQTELKISTLGELTEDEFEKNKHLIKSDIRAKRAKHAVYENQRTLKAVKALEDNDIETFGKLMNQSHNSLRDDYEVTGKELDTLVDLASKHEGTVGARMTGAGFGGCTVSIVKRNNVDDFINNVGKQYKEIIGYDADFYVANIGAGTREI
ncbi:MAG: galactokinase [Clostridiales bacterium]|uniref:galactokinase n=1 Tax=Terrisporobacter sp. TaxID=1965305 RepID=UPI002A554B7A|nr:galactokinase [Terrisporobacter sp.]MCI5628913.1 galactokinase [Clostridium sp.]MDD7755511.1 galactokinase [Clostridiales bacterium]MDY4134873.1 galactokinase [Terrisporobacter sp.]MDY4737771.1 galactokinase [Terrisporobacter sp.]MDY6153112.1 galactokinase [Terrisporobacter sp.]